MPQSPAIIRLALGVSLLGFACAEFTHIPSYFSKDLHVYCHRQNTLRDYGNSYDASQAFQFCLLRNAATIKNGSRLWADYAAKRKAAMEDKSIIESHNILIAEVESDYQRSLQVNTEGNSYLLEMLDQMKEAKLREIGSLEEWAIRQRGLHKHAFKELPSEIQWYFDTKHEAER